MMKLEYIKIQLLRLQSAGKEAIMYQINEDVTIYYKQIHREYTRGKENFDKRFPIMEQRAKKCIRKVKLRHDR